MPALVRIAVSIGLAIAIAGPLSVVEAARADDVTSERPVNAKKKKKPRREFVVTPVVFNKLETIHELLEAGETDEALRLLDKLSKRKLTDHETAIVQQTYAFAWSNKSDYPKAAAAFEKCLATDALPETSLNTVRYNLGQLYMAMEQFEKAIEQLERWMEDVEKPGANAYYLIGIAYAQLDKQKEALPYIEKAVEHSKSFNESWRQLLLALYFDQKRYEEAVEVLDGLIAHSPKKSYLQQLQGIYGELDQEQKALAVMELSYRLGYLETDLELRNLARLYLYHEIPYQSARVMEKGLSDGVIEGDAEAWELLADSWIHAREYDQALEPLSKAAERSDDGEIYLKLARVHMEEQGWNDARVAIEAAIAKGGLRNPGDAQLILGISNVNAKRYKSARSAFQRAAQSKTSKKSAESWLKHLDTLEAQAAEEAAYDEAG